LQIVAREVTRVAFSELIDYAGVFPPASLGMNEAVRRFVAHRTAPQGWMLGRIVVAAPRLDDFERSTAEVLGRSHQAEPWRVAVVASQSLAEVVNRIQDFNRRHGARVGTGVVIDALEVKAGAAHEIEAAAGAVPAGFELFVEFPVTDQPGELPEAIARCGAMAKIRTGGVTPDQVPSAADLAATILACYRAGASFKATAGLHDPLTSVRPLTYDADAPRATMYGFLNLLVAASLVGSGLSDAAEIVRVLEDESAESFVSTGEGVAWRGRRFSVPDLRVARKFFRSFGSCSFDEPVAGLVRLGMA